jgi:hypothetical protein
MQVYERRPISLLSTNLPGPEEDGYAPDHMYEAGALVVVKYEADGSTPRTPHAVYRSLRGNNIGRYPPDHVQPVPETATSSTSVTVENGSKTFTVEPGKAFVPGMAVDIKKTVTPRAVHMSGDVTAYNAGTGQLVVLVFRATGEGSHSGWTVELADEIGFWEYVGATNQWAMFDGSVGRKTYGLPGEPIEVEIDASRCDGVSLFGLEGERIEAELTDLNTGEVVESWDLSLRLDGVTSIWEYFFTPYEWRHDLVLNFPLYFSSKLRLRIIPAPGGVAECGNVLPGMSWYIGMTKYGASIGNQVFSRSVVQDGETHRVPDGWAKRMSLDIEVENADIDKLQRLFAKLQGEVCVWQGNNRDVMFESLLVLGFYGDFEVVIPGKRYSKCSLDILGVK